jgi:hypothetical protein
MLQGLRDFRPRRSDWIYALYRSYERNLIQEHFVYFVPPEGNIREVSLEPFGNHRGSERGLLAMPRNWIARRITGKRAGIAL